MKETPECAYWGALVIFLYSFCTVPPQTKIVCYANVVGKQGKFPTLQMKLESPNPAKCIIVFSYF